tara:strand:- start:768 stop:1049 length:282 start_codon:yes stop_codon:yes gene_type:complete
LAGSNFTSEAQAMDAKNFQASHRGTFIQAQALYYAIQKLSEVEGVMREVSNIADMQYLLDELYPGYEGIFDHIDQQRCTLQHGEEVHNHMGSE